MALFEDVLKGGIGPGLVVGVGAVLLGPYIAPAVTAALRPAAKGVIKAGIFAYDRGCEAMARLNELSGDIVAEARSEMEQRRGPAEAESGE